jgi:hypothetical protein
MEGCGYYTRRQGSKAGKSTVMMVYMVYCVFVIVVKANSKKLCFSASGMQVESIKEGK